MENNRLLQTCRVYKKRQLWDFVFYSVICAYFTLCYYADKMGGERSEDCTMKAGLANVLFAWILVGA